MLDNISSGKRLPEKSLLVLGEVNSQEKTGKELTTGRRNTRVTARVSGVGVNRGLRQPETAGPGQEATDCESVCARLYLPRCAGYRP